jgi:hypothetical protein
LVEQFCSWSACRIQSTLEARVRLVPDLGHLVHHREEVAGVAQVVVRIDVRETELVPVGEGGERRHLRDQANGGHVPLLRVLDALRTGVERGERPDSAYEHAHGVGVVAEPLHELLHVLVDVGVVGDLVDPAVKLVARGQLPVDEEVGHLQVGGVLAEVLDRVAAVLEHPGLAVDVGDLAGAGCRVGEGGVECHQPEVVVVHLDAAQVHRADGPVLDLELVALAGAVIGDRERLPGGGYRAVTTVLLCVLFRHGRSLW